MESNLRKNKRSSFMLMLLCIVCVMLAMTGCKKKGAKAGSGTYGKENPKIASADDIIKEAENGSYKSADSDSEELYADTDIPYETYNIFIQKYVEEDIPVYEGDATYFVPAGKDYFYGCFDGKKTMLYVFDQTGEVVSVQGRIVYESKDELLKENSGMSLTEDSYNEDGYTYHGNVLYYRMDEASLFALTMCTDKENLLMTATNGYWDDALYYFSMPYFEENPMEYADLLDPEFYTAGDDTWKEREEEPAYKLASESELHDLFDHMMRPYTYTPESYATSVFTSATPEEIIAQYYNTSYRGYDEFDRYAIRVIDCGYDNLAYAVNVNYTVPGDYPDTAVDNFMVAAPILYEEETESWKIVQNEDVWNAIEDGYYAKVLTDDAYDAYTSGNFFRRLWVPFDLENPFYFGDVFTTKVIQAYMDNYGDLYVTLYFYNDTPSAVEVLTLDRLVLSCETGILADVGGRVDVTIPAHDFLYDTLRIPAEYLEREGFTTLTVDAYEYSLN